MALKSELKNTISYGKGCILLKYKSTTSYSKHIEKDSHGTHFVTD